MNSLIKIIISALLVILLCTPISAQPEWDDDPIDTPIDAGLSLLIISGLGLGIHSIKRNTKK